MVCWLTDAVEKSTGRAAVALAPKFPKGIVTSCFGGQMSRKADLLCDANGREIGCLVLVLASD